MKNFLKNFVAGLVFLGLMAGGPVSLLSGVLILFEYCGLNGFVGWHIDLLAILLYILPAGVLVGMCYVLGNGIFRIWDLFKKEDQTGVYYYEGGKTMDHFDCKEVLHRMDGPAAIHSNGTREWFQNGLLHRENMPACIHCNGDRYYYQNGKLHRTDGPAVDWSNGDKEWWIDGKLHRIDGPAIIKSDGSNEYYQNGKRHRVDGPAVDWKGEPKKYFLEGEEYNKQQFETLTATTLMKIRNEIFSLLWKDWTKKEDE